MEDTTPLPPCSGSGACHLGLCSIGVPRPCSWAKRKGPTARPEYQKEKGPGEEGTSGMKKEE